MYKIYTKSNKTISITPEVMRKMEQQKNAEKAVHMFMELIMNDVNRHEKKKKIQSENDYFNYLVDARIEDTNTIMKYFGDELDKLTKEKSHQNYQIPEDKRQELDDPESWDDCLEFPEDYEDDPINELLFGHHGVEYR